MINRMFDDRYSFETIFDDQTGAYYRSNVQDEKGNDTGVDPFMASFPHHLDIGIMGQCIHGLSGKCASAGVGCYQSGGNVIADNMPLKDYCRIMDECSGKVFQVALGGRGDPDCHEHFAQILEYSRQKHIVPNFTTSGYAMTAQKAKIASKYCGAVAVSYYRNEYTYSAIDLFLKVGMTVNLHYILDASTIDEAIAILENGFSINEIGAIVFLLHKPVGQGRLANILDIADPRVERLFRLFADNPSKIKVGFDSCCTPLVMSFAKDLPQECYDACEGARFSAYIGSDGMMTPCSFDVEGKWALSLQNRSISDVWHSDVFEGYRNGLLSACPTCSLRSNCYGGCPISPEINTCSYRMKEVIS